MLYSVLPIIKLEILKMLALRQNLIEGKVMFSVFCKLFSKMGSGGLRIVFKT